MKCDKPNFITFCILTFLVVQFITSCNAKGGKLDSKPFYEGKTKLPDGLVNHFPVDIDSSIITYNSSYRNKPEAIRYLTMLKKMSVKEQEIIDNLNASPDSCIIEIYLFRNTYEYYNKESHDKKVYVPVPDFSLIISDMEKPNDIKYYVLEKNNKAIINHDLYLRYYLPPEWRNGLSRGIGISKEQNLIFYWTVLW